MEFRGQLEVIRHRFLLIVACVLLAGFSAYIVSSTLPKTYTGKVTLIVGQPLTASNPDPNALLASQRLSVTYATVATEADQLTGLGTQTLEPEQQLQTDEARLITLRSAYSSLLQFSSS